MSKQPGSKEKRLRVEHEAVHGVGAAQPAPADLCHLMCLLKKTAVTTCADRGVAAPSGARSLWLVRPSSRPRMLLSGLGTPAWAVSLPATKKRNFAVGSNGATSSSVCPVATTVRHSAVRPGSATEALNSYVNRCIRNTVVPTAVTAGRLAGSGGPTATTRPPGGVTGVARPPNQPLSLATDAPASPSATVPSETRHAQPV